MEIKLKWQGQTAEKSATSWARLAVPKLNLTKNTIPHSEKKLTKNIRPTDILQIYTSI